MGLVTGIVGLLGPIGKIIDKVIPDPNLKEKLQAELMQAMMNADSEFYKAAGSIVTAEAQGENWMQRNWRPLTMLTFVFIIANNYIIVPWVTWLAGLVGFNFDIPVLEIPPGMWGLLQIGIGGYIGSRGVEKVVEKVQSRGVPLIQRGTDSKTIENLREETRETREEMKTTKEELLASLRGA